MKQPKVILSGGGTGGHIFPAVAIAKELKKRYPAVEVLFVGAKGKMEMEKVPAEGFKIKGLWISGFHRKLTLRNLMFPFKLVFSLLKAVGIILRYKPQLVIGTGGFASGPIMKAASWCGVKTVLQEQNSYAGVTNKLAANKASKVFVAFDGMDKYFQKEKIVVTGNPIRQTIVDFRQLDKSEALQLFELDPHKKTLLIMVVV